LWTSISAIPEQSTLPKEYNVQSQKALQPIAKVRPPYEVHRTSGQAGGANTDLTYPATGMTQSGRGVVAFTLTGDSDYPSAALAGLDAKAGIGSVEGLFQHL